MSFAPAQKRQFAGIPLTVEHVARVRHVRFHDEASGAIIVELADGAGAKGECEARALEAGTTYRFTGRWRESDRWGRTFYFDTYSADVPHDCRGVVRYLATEARYVGRATAEKLWAAYGSRAVEILRAEPARVAADGVMDSAEAHTAAADLERVARFEKTKVDLITLFAGRGLGKKSIARCIELWGVRAAEMVRRNPWLLLTKDVPGAGFKRVDRIFQELGGDPVQLKRQMLAGWDSLRQGIEGNTWHPLGAFRAGVINQCGARDVDPLRALELGIRAKWLRASCPVMQGNFVAEAQKAGNESDLAYHLRLLMNSGPGEWPAVNPPAVSVHQSDRFDSVRGSRVAILAGTPGTGKTYLAAAVLRELVTRWGSGAIAVCAPTGKAAVRITEALGRNGVPLVATTIHRLLEIGRNGHDGAGWGFVRCESNPLPQRVVAVDEVSMLDTDLAADLVRALQPGTHLLLIGDPYQLPPVGHGAPLRDMIAAGVPTARLEEIQRNSGAIVRACADIKDGRRFSTVDKIDEAAGENLRLIECEDETAQKLALCRIMDAIARDGRRDPVWDSQILTPLNEKSGVSRKPLNIILQGLLNPLCGDRETHQLGEFRLHDKIICLKNCKLPAQEYVPGSLRTDPSGYCTRKDAGWRDCESYVANGDLGRVLALDVAKKALIVEFLTPSRVVRIPLGRGGDEQSDTSGGEAADFALAYAITVHKSQGSEWPLVIVILDEAAGPVACRELLYTAISRARGACVMLGRRGVADRQTAKVTLLKRKTFLKELLCNGK